ncbi:unnamed protein product [Penicillium pancosmium]
MRSFNTPSQLGLQIIWLNWGLTENNVANFPPAEVRVFDFKTNSKKTIKAFETDGAIPMTPLTSSKSVNPPTSRISLAPNSLEKADYFDLSGTMESVSLPKLEVLGYIDHTEPFPSQGLSIIIEDEETLDFDAPKLHTLNGMLFVYGVYAWDLWDMGGATQVC